MPAASGMGGRLGSGGSSVEGAMVDDVALFMSPEARLLGDTLQRADQVTNEMVSLLDGLDGRLAGLESVVAPIHQQAKVLTARSSNLQGVVTELASIISFFDLADASRALILEGRVRETTGAYLAQLDALQHGAAVLERSKIRGGSAVTSQLRSLYETGLARVRQDLGMLLKEAEPELAGALAALRDLGSASSETGAGAYLLDTDVLPVVSRLVAYLGEANCADIFVNARWAFLERVLHELAQLATPSAAATTAAGAVAFERGRGPLIVYMHGIARLLAMERNLLEYALPHTSRDVLARLAAPAAESFLEAAEAVAVRIKRGLAAHEYRDLFALFDLLAAVRPLQEDLERLLAHCGRPVTAVSDAVALFRNVASTAFRELLGETRRPLRASTQPSDGTVHETTSHVIGFLQRLISFRGTVDLLLPPPHSGALALYTLDLLEALWANLEVLARTYRRPLLAAIFLLNNCHYILRFLRDPPSMALAGKDAEAAFADRMAAQLEDYQACWKGTIEHLLEVNAGRHAGGALLKKASSKKVKERFAAFNKELEEMQQLHVEYAVPDRELRKQLKQTLAGVIVPIYAQFIDRYAHTGFSKRPEKYIKYSPEDLEALFSRLFEGS